MSRLERTFLTPNVNSDSHFIRIGWLERLKLIPPFNAAARVSRTNAPPTQPEHIPFLGSYFISENGGPDGDANTAEPRFSVTLKCGYSWVIQNNDPETAEDMLDAAYWAFMKLLHDPNWKFFPIPDMKPIELESILGYELSRHYGNLSHTNETPIAEMRLEVEFFWRNYFAPTIPDLFEIFHSTTAIKPPADPNEVAPIIIELNLPQ
jgi:hypothetical protein